MRLSPTPGGAHANDVSCDAICWLFVNLASRHSAEFAFRLFWRLRRAGSEYHDVSTSAAHAMESDGGEGLLFFSAEDLRRQELQISTEFVTITHAQITIYRSAANFNLV